MSSNETNMTEVSEGDREKLNIISKLLNTDLTQESILPEVKLKCFAGYAMYLCALEDKTSKEVQKLFSKNEEIFDIVTKNLTNDSLKMTALIDMAILNASFRTRYDVPTVHTKMKSLSTKVVVSNQNHYSRLCACAVTCASVPVTLCVCVQCA